MKLSQMAAESADLVSDVDAMSVAWEHFRGGRLALAEGLARRAIEAQASNAEAANLLGVIAHRGGRMGEAIGWMEKAIAADPKVASLHGNLCEMHRRMGDLERALAAGERAVEIDPFYVQGLNNLGIVHFERRNFEAAEALYRRALQRDPKYVEALNNLANSLRAQRKFEDAEAAYRQAVKLRPKYAEALANLGAMLRDTGRFAEAEAVLRRAILARPDYVEAYNSLALTLLDLKRTEEALGVLARAVASEPDRAEALVLMATLLLDQGKAEGAFSACQRALRNRPEHPGALNLMGRIKRDLEDVEGSVECIRKALTLRPDAPDILNNLGISLLESGDLAGAAKALERAAELQPQSLSTLINLASAKKFRPGAPEIEALEKAVAREDLGDCQRASLHYSLGKVLDDTGAHERAFAEFVKGAEIKRRTLKYEEAPMLRLFDRIRQVFTARTIEEKTGFGDPTVNAVFIVGMPRSGSTLVEQVLASHPAVHALGEVKYLHQGICDVDRIFGSAIRYPELLHLMERPQFEAIAQHYRSKLPDLGAGKTIFTDKMLTNYYYVGLVYLLFPNARVIHCRRSAIDTCISCFSKMFREEMAYTYDLKELAHFYRKYAELMAYWKKVLPENFILDVAYEDVVGDLEGEGRRIVAHCGLEWDAACLDFHKTERPVKTASVTQVRQPLYASSVERWRNYGTLVDPLIAELGPLAF